MLKIRNTDRILKGHLLFNILSDHRQCIKFFMSCNFFFIQNNLEIFSKKLYKFNIFLIIKTLQTTVQSLDRFLQKMFK